MKHEALLHIVRDETTLLLKKLSKQVFTLYLCLSRIPSSTDGWMDYVPISEKKKVVDSAQLKEGESHQRSEIGV